MSGSPENVITCLPLRGLDDFLSGFSRYHFAKLVQLTQDDGRLIHNLLYYQSNYFLGYNLTAWPIMSVSIYKGLLSKREALLGVAIPGTIFYFYLLDRCLNPDFPRKAKDEEEKKEVEQFKNSWLGLIHSMVFPLIKVGLVISIPLFVKRHPRPTFEVACCLSPPLLLILAHAKTRVRPNELAIGFKWVRNVFNDVTFQELLPTPMGALFIVMGLIPVPNGIFASNYFRW